MHPVTRPRTACVRWPQLPPLASSARHPVPHTHTATATTQTDDTGPRPRGNVRAARAAGGRAGAGGTGRQAVRVTDLAVFAVYRRLCSPAGSPRSRSWRRSATNTAAGTTRTSAAGTLLSRPRSTRLPAFLPLTVSILVD